MTVTAARQHPERRSLKEGRGTRHIITRTVSKRSPQSDPQTSRSGLAGHTHVRLPPHRGDHGSDAGADHREAQQHRRDEDRCWDRSVGGTRVVLNADAGRQQRESGADEGTALGPPPARCLDAELIAAHRILVEPGDRARPPLTQRELGTVDTRHLS